MIEGVSWEPSSVQDVCAPLKECLYFSVRGYVDEQPQCFPGLDSHTCTLSIDKVGMKLLVLFHNLPNFYHYLSDITYDLYTTTLDIYYCTVFFVSNIIL